MKEITSVEYVRINKNKNCELVANIKVLLYFYNFEDFT